jgi:uncharacterized repeat protein (TIGR03803 family)
MGKLNRGMRAFSFSLFWAMAAVALHAQTFTTLHSFDGTDGSNPEAGLVHATDGDFYGTTSFGGANSDCEGTSCGTVFKITPSGTLTTLHSFDGKEGFESRAGLVQAPKGGLYGTTVYGGAIKVGTVFKISPSGKLATVHSFDYAPEGAGPYAGLVRATDGKFYGTTPNGGAGSAGTVFVVTPGGHMAALYAFCYNCANGAQPTAPLIQAADGNLYGTALYGGVPDQCGTVFKITRSGRFTLLHSFTAKDGCYPWGALVESTDGNLYGAALAGGANHNSGTFFKITRSGRFTLLHTFNGTDGAGPLGALVQATDGNFYGTTVGGGANAHGTIFKITPSGAVTTLYSFCSQSNCTDGSSPYAALVQGTDGKFYGTTESGGAYNDGTVFSLSGGLGPFGQAQAMGADRQHSRN